MGCDYYIDKNLYIYYHNDNKYSVINLERQRGYFYNSFDEDDEDYEKKLAKEIKDCLKPNMKPIVIYSNDSFHQPNFEYKYKELIENEVKKDFNKKWSDIKEVIKKESRFERD